MPAKRKLPAGGRTNLRLTVPVQVFVAFRDYAREHCLRSVNAQIETMMAEAGAAWKARHATPPQESAHDTPLA